MQFKKYIKLWSILWFMHNSKFTYQYCDNIKIIQVMWCKEVQKTLKVKNIIWQFIHNKCMSTITLMQVNWNSTHNYIETLRLRCEFDCNA